MVDTRYNCKITITYLFYFCQVIITICIQTTQGTISYLRLYCYVCVPTRKYIRIEHDPCIFLTIFITLSSHMYIIILYIIIKIFNLEQILRYLKLKFSVNTIHKSYLNKNNYNFPFFFRERQKFNSEIYKETTCLTKVGKKNEQNKPILRERLPVQLSWLQTLS